MGGATKVDVINSAAGIFNSTVAGFAIAAAWEVGALDELQEHGSIDAGQFSAELDLHPESVRSMFAALSAADVVVRDGDKVHTGPRFAEVFRHKAFFHWLTIGCAELFADMPNLLRNEYRVGRFYRRNAAAIAHACRDINQQSFDPVFWQAIEELDFGFRTVADLGCGSGGRLAQIAARFPGIRGVGIDIAGAALRDASDYLAAAGLANQFELIEADVLSIEPDPRYEPVEVLTCFMMGHDFWPREKCVATLQRLRRAFPNARRFLLGDTARTEEIEDRDKPVFTLGFETAHDLMGVYLPTLAEWQGVFAESGWTCLSTRTVEVPVDSFIYELV